VEQRARHRGGGVGTDAGCEPVELGERDGVVEVGMGVPGDEECGLVEREVGRFPAHERREPLGGVGHGVERTPLRAGRRPPVHSARWLRRRAPWTTG
jgi:hypothetical protein